MNSSRKLRWLFMLALAPVLPSAAVTVNDGSTTNNLTQILNSNPLSRADSVVSLRVDNCPNCALTAVQTGDNSLAFFALRSAWYANEVAPTSGVYTVSAGFQPANVGYQNRGGVMGWLSLSASNGIVLQVVPEDGFFNDPKSFRVAVVDFSAENGNDNESVAHLFDTNGTPATADFPSAWSDLGTNYLATNFATFQLAFSVPTAADLAALATATAHVTARVFQGTNTTGTPIQVSRSVELLTDLPLPPPGKHKFGYYAVWGSTIDQGDIGYLDNLAGEGGVGAAANSPPLVSISSPPSGASFTASDPISIVADATDNDGTVTSVDFFANTTLLGTATNSPFTLTWSNVIAGSYALTARATDNRGGTSTSSPVSVTVNSSTGGGPALMIVLAANGVEISWPMPGYLLQMTTNLSSPVWTDVPNTVATNRVTLSLLGGTTFFRLFQQGTPTGPRLTVQLSGNTVVVSWPQVTGYKLQAKSDLNAASWTDVVTTGNQVTETITSATRFYRLSP